MLIWFCLSAVFVVYSYFLYPLVLKLMQVCLGSRNALPEPAHRPGLSLIITAHNEERRIRAKIDNSLAIEYAGELELIVASDGSTDGTNAIVQEYAERGVRLVETEQWLGKENAQLEAMSSASHDIMVFSDVATQIPADALDIMAGYFADETVGAVSSEDRFIAENGRVEGEGLYVRYEMWLRQQESRLAGLVGLSGSFFAVRSSVVKEHWDIRCPSDFNTALSCARQGVRSVTAPDVLGYYPNLSDSSKEYQRKVRTALRGMTALKHNAELLNPFRFGVFALQVWSHKILRWVVPWALLSLLVSTLLLYPHPLAQLALLPQLAFYLIAFLTWRIERLQAQALCRVIYFFCQVNLALAVAGLRMLRGQSMYNWQPSAR